MIELVRKIKDFFDDFDLQIQSDELKPEDYDERVFLLMQLDEEE